MTFAPWAEVEHLACGVTLRRPKMTPAPSGRGNRRRRREREDSEARRRMMGGLARSVVGVERAEAGVEVEGSGILVSCRAPSNWNVLLFFFP